MNLEINKLSNLMNPPCGKTTGYPRFFDSSPGTSDVPRSLFSRPMPPLSRFSQRLIRLWRKSFGESPSPFIPRRGGGILAEGDKNLKLKILSSHNYIIQTFWSLCQVFYSSLLNYYHILQPHSTPTFEINARFYCHNHTRF